MKLRALLSAAFLAAALTIFAQGAQAQQAVSPCAWVATSQGQTCIPLPGPIDWSHSQAVGTSAATVLAANLAHYYVLLHNPSAPGGNTLYCSFSATAVANAFGTLSIAPGQYITMEASGVARTALSCIATGASTPLTIGVD